MTTRTPARSDLLFRLGVGSLALALLLGLWHAASATGIFGRMDPVYSQLLLPSPLAVGQALWETATTGYLWQHVSISLVRVGVGFALAVGIGVPLGLLIGTSRWGSAALDPIVRIFSPIPGIAWVPLAILWFGLGNQAAIFIIVIGSVFPIVISTVQGIQDIDRQLVAAARMMGADRGQVLRRVLLPGLVPYLVTGFRIGMGFAWRVVIAAEMVGVPDGVGYMLNVGRATGRTDVTILTMVILGALMLVIESLLFDPLERRTRLWRGGTRS